MRTRAATVLIGEDDDGHAALVRKNLERAGVTNEILRFHDGQEILDFLAGTGGGRKHAAGTPYLLVLDIRMPKVDGVEVLRRLKSDEKLKAVPVIVLSTTEDPREVERCHRLGCNGYIVKPIDSEGFSETIRRLGLFILVVQVPAFLGAA